MPVQVGVHFVCECAVDVVGLILFFEDTNFLHLYKQYFNIAFVLLKKYLQYSEETSLSNHIKKK